MFQFWSLLAKIAVLSLVVLLFYVLSLLGIMPLEAVRVFVNTLLIGAVLFLMADIMLNKPIRQKH